MQSVIEKTNPLTPAQSRQHAIDQNCEHSGTALKEEVKQNHADEMECLRELLLAMSKAIKKN